MSRQITLTLTDEEYERYLDSLAALTEVKDIDPEAKLLILFNSRAKIRIPFVRAAVPETEIIDLSAFEGVAASAWNGWTDNNGR